MFYWMVRYVKLVDSDLAKQLGPVIDTSKIKGGLRLLIEESKEAHRRLIH